jgi:hypothetical protein
MPPAVSPTWVLESWKQDLLALPSDYPPIKAVVTSAIKNKAAIPSEPSTTKNGSISKSNSASTVFRGCLFSLVRLAPPAWAVDFDTKQQESFVKAHGGQILSIKLMDAMKADTKNGARKRKCHVVCWGGRPNLQLNPIISQLQRHDLCELVLVTPIWLQTCATVQKRVRPDRLSLVLAPQPWPLRTLAVGESSTKLSIAMTGFQGTEKAALVHLFQAVRGTFHDNMNNSNTHLICKEKATGLKLEKAIEWGLHIVSLDWLFHVVEFGYGGKEKAKGGCESRFSLRDISESDGR